MIEIASFAAGAVVMWIFLWFLSPPGLKIAYPQKELSRNRVTMAPLCAVHLSELVHGCQFKESDPWRALVLSAQIALFQGATADPETHKRTKGDLRHMPSVGCLACYQPGRFLQLVDVGQREGIGGIKKLGEHWVQQATGRKI